MVANAEEFNMFDKFTDRARKSLGFAREEALTLKNNYISTGHMLIGLLREEFGVAATILTNSGLTLDQLREEVNFVINKHTEPSQAPEGALPFTLSAKKSLEDAAQESQKLGHNYIGTEHLLLGILNNKESMGMIALQNYSQNPEQSLAPILRNLVLERIGPTAAQEEKSAEPQEAELTRRSISEWQKEAYRTAKSKGFHSSKEINLWKYVGNIHAEVSEAWEEIRKPDFEASRIYYRKKDNKPEGFGMELADIVIRVLDTAETLGLDLEKFMFEKNEFNKTRPYRHGNKNA